MKQGNLFLILNIAIPLMLGAVIYYLFSPDVIFVKAMDELIGGGIHLNQDVIVDNTMHLIYQFIRNYLLDMLWGYALLFSLYFICGNNTVNLKRFFVIVLTFSICMEVLQLSPVAKGTFDVFDIVAEAIAEIIAVLIIKIHSIEEDILV